jgi:membrane-anchored protein YejM (alkaline phosphatase superfamily)
LYAKEQITFNEILENPSDLDLNLRYAKEQEIKGKYKATIAALERLNMLYPKNTDIKLYLISILLKIDSSVRLELMMDTMLQDPNTSKEARKYIEDIQKIIQLQSKPKNPWFAYIDLGYTHTENSNVAGVTKTKTLYQTANGVTTIRDWQIDSIEYDKTYSKAAR